MTKAELIEKIARSRELPPDLSKKCIQQILDIAFDELGNYFTRARVTRNQTPRFTFPGFGTFTKKKRSARRGVNPRTLEPMEIKASFTVDFKPGAELRRTLNGTPSKRRRQGRDSGPVTASESKEPVNPRIELDEQGARAAPPEPVSPNLARVRPRLRPRDEVEFDGMAAGRDATLFTTGCDPDLPSAPLQRVRAPAPNKSEKTG